MLSQVIGFMLLTLVVTAWSARARALIEVRCNPRGLRHQREEGRSRDQSYLMAATRESNASRDKDARAVSITGEIVSISRAALDMLAAPRDSTGTVHGVRRLRQGRTGVRIQYFPSAKSGAHIPCEGDPEVACAVARERDCAVDSYRSQPLTILLDCNHQYTPDFLVRLCNGRLQLLEVKSLAELQQPETNARLAEARALAAVDGIDLIEMSHESLPAPDLAQQLLRLYDSTLPASRYEDFLVDLRAQFGPTRELYYWNLCSRLAPLGWPPRWVNHAIFLEHLAANLKSPVGACTLITLRT